MPQFQTKNIVDASPEELRRYASQFLGIPIAEDTKDAEVLAKVKSANEGDTIFVDVGDAEVIDQRGSPPPAAAAGGGLIGSLGRSDPKVTLTLHAEERDGVVINRHKEVGVNGQVWLLKRGEPITIPYRVFEALENAERHVITHTGEGEIREQKVKNTPYNIVRMPTPEEITEWHEKTDAAMMP